MSPTLSNVSKATSQGTAFRHRLADALTRPPLRDGLTPLALVRRSLAAALVLLAVVGGQGAGTAFAQDAQSQLKAYAAAAKSTPSVADGQSFFTSKHGGDWSCSSCHGAPPTGQGKHVVTNKAIAPLAPAFNAERFTDTAKSDKWFRRNCKDVLTRECTDAEKANILAFLLSLKK
jgi:Domain of unknown function (DUF1924)